MSSVSEQNNPKSTTEIGVGPNNNLTEQLEKKYTDIITEYETIQDEINNYITDNQKILNDIRNISFKNNNFKNNISSNRETLTLLFNNLKELKQNFANIDLTSFKNLYTNINNFTNELKKKEQELHNRIKLIENKLRASISSNIAENNSPSENQNQLTNEKNRSDQYLKYIAKLNKILKEMKTLYKKYLEKINNINDEFTDLYITKVMELKKQFIDHYNKIIDTYQLNNLTTKITKTELDSNKRRFIDDLINHSKVLKKYITICSKISQNSYNNMFTKNNINLAFYKNKKAIINSNVTNLTEKINEINVKLEEFYKSVKKTSEEELQVLKNKIIELIIQIKKYILEQKGAKHNLINKLNEDLYDPLLITGINANRTIKEKMSNILKELNKEIQPELRNKSPSEQENRDNSQVELASIYPSEQESSGSNPSIGKNREKQEISDEIGYEIKNNTDSQKSNLILKRNNLKTGKNIMWTTTGSNGKETKGYGTIIDNTINPNKGRDKIKVKVYTKNRMTGKISDLNSNVSIYPKSGKREFKEWSGIINGTNAFKKNVQENLKNGTEK